MMTVTIGVMVVLVMAVAGVFGQGESDCDVQDPDLAVVQVLVDNGDAGQFRTVAVAEFFASPDEDDDEEDDDDNGLEEIVACGNEGCIILQDGNEIASIDLTEDMPAGVDFVVAGEFDGDAFNDLVVGGADGLRFIKGVEDVTDEDLVIAEDLIVAGDGRAVTGIAVGDFNADGQDEIVVGTDDNKVSVFISFGGELQDEKVVFDSAVDPNAENPATLENPRGFVVAEIDEQDQVDIGFVGDDGLGWLQSVPELDEVALVEIRGQNFNKFDVIRADQVNSVNPLASLVFKARGEDETNDQFVFFREKVGNEEEGSIRGYSNPDWKNGGIDGANNVNPAVAGGRGFVSGDFNLDKFDDLIFFGDVEAQTTFGLQTNQAIGGVQVAFNEPDEFLEIEGVIGQAIAVDIDQDGDLDVVIANLGDDDENVDSSVSILTNNCFDNLGAPSVSPTTADENNNNDDNDGADDALQALIVVVIVMCVLIIVALVAAIVCIAMRNKNQAPASHGMTRRASSRRGMHR